MTRQEKQKAIDALKISTPVMAVTQEEFNDYIQTLNKIMDWLEQESVLNKIKEEIKDATYFINETTEKEGVDFETVEKIINKYMAESEG